MNFYNLEKFIEETECIIIGSRALGVSTPESDYDLCVMEDDLPEFLNDILHGPSDMFNIKRYFSLYLLHNAYLIPKITFSFGKEFIYLKKLSNITDLLKNKSFSIALLMCIREAYNIDINVLYASLVGSKLYGTDTGHSDTEIRFIFRKS